MQYSLKTPVKYVTHQLQLQSRPKFKKGVINNEIKSNIDSHNVSQFSVIRDKSYQKLSVKKACSISHISASPSQIMRRGERVPTFLLYISKKIRNKIINLEMR